MKVKIIWVGKPKHGTGTRVGFIPEGSEERQFVTIPQENAPLRKGPAEFDQVNNTFIQNDSSRNDYRSATSPEDRASINKSVSLQCATEIVKNTVSSDTDLDTVFENLIEPLARQMKNYLDS